MPESKPKRASEYKSEQFARVRATCLYVATKLGDIMDELVVVGGLVPSLIVDQEALGGGQDQHVGTMDLDVGLALGLLDRGRYRTLAERLRDAGFQMDANVDGNATRQRWTISESGGVGVDFLIPPSTAQDRGGSLRDLERDFAAIIAPGLTLAFQDRERVTIRGTTLANEKAERNIWVCGPGAFIVLKALAFDSRGENKDAYDLYYVLRSYGVGVDDVVARMRPLASSPDAAKALGILRRDFVDPQAVGPRRVAEFMRGQRDDDIQADVVGFVAQLLSRM